MQNTYDKKMASIKKASEMLILIKPHLYEAKRS